MKKFVGCVTAVAAFMFIVSSCNLDSGTSNPQTGFFMVGQISPDAPHLNITINGATFDTGLAFGNYTPYVSANAGVYNFVFYPTGSSTPVINNSLNIEVNKTYSYYVIDSFTKVKTAVVQDVFTAPPGDSVYVRFFHFSPNVYQPIDVIDSTHGSATLFSGRTFNDQSFNPSFTTFNRLVPGIYRLQIKQFDGTILISQDVTLEGGKVYTLFAKGCQGGTGDQVLSFGQLVNYPQ